MSGGEKLLVFTGLLLSLDACGEPPMYASMKIKGVGKPTYDPGERVQYVCRPGYKRVFTLPAYTVCTYDGQWTSLEADACISKYTGFSFFNFHFFKNFIFY